MYGLRINKNFVQTVAKNRSEKWEKDKKAVKPIHENLSAKI
jgi:hypothetical protein